jgi:Flp pilus assembly protein TadB
VTGQPVILAIAFVVCGMLGAAVALLAQSIVRKRRLALGARFGDDPSSLGSPLVALPEELLPKQSALGRFDRWFARLVGESGLNLSAETAFFFAVCAGLLACGALLAWRDDLLAAAAGLAAGSPIELVGATVTEPLGGEFRRCSRQLKLGLSLDSVMQQMVRRAPLTEVRIFATALVVQRRTGGNLPLTLERLGRVVRDRISYHRQFRASTGAGRVSAILIGAAGPLVAIYLMIWQREYIGRFTETFTGQALLTTAIVLQVVGVIWIYLTLRSDY